jgi:plasmid replication initiation protein
MSELTVVKHNELIQASYSLSLIEQRLILAGIAQIDSTSELTQQHMFKVHASDISDLMSVDRKNAYRDLKKAADMLWQREILIDGQADKLRWIYRRAAYESNGGVVSLYFSPDLLPYLSELKANFTKYKLEYISNFRSAYGIRLYELLVQWASKGSREVEVDWLKEAFQLEGKYSSIKNLKARVIQPAIDDINTHSNLWVTFGQRKCGRTITHLQFEFGLKSEQKQPKQKRITTADIQKAARPGETTGQVVARLTGNDLSKTAKRGESTQQALQRKQALAEAKKSLRGNS